MSKIRIHEYAKEKGLTSKEIIDFLESKNIEVKSHMSSLEDDVLKVLDAEFNKNAKDAAQKPAGKQPAAKQNSKQNQQKNNNNKNQKQKNSKNKATKNQEAKKQEPKKAEPENKHFTYEEGITVGELAEKIGVDSSVIVKDLFMLGIVTNINQSLDQDSVEVVAENYGFTSELEVFRSEEH